MDLKYTFAKHERLKSEAEISLVYNTGEKSFSYPFKVYYHKHTSGDESLSSIPKGQLLRICISVPKRKFKKAVDRNLIKRRTREAFRLNKHLWYEKAEKQSTDLYLIFIGNELTEYSIIEKALKKTLNNI